MSEYKASVCQIDITPDYPTTLIGRYRPQDSNGIDHRLYAQVLLLQGKDVFCLITIDSLGFNVELSNILRTRLAERMSTDRSHIMLCFSHTHSAPDPTSFGTNGERYFQFLCDKVEQCVNTAMGKFVPCKIAWDLTIADIGANRRNGGTALDDRLGGMLISDTEGKPIVLVVRFCAHANILPAENLQVSSDFVGKARETLQTKFDYPVMFVQGATGNVKAKGTNLVGEGDSVIFDAVTMALVNAVETLHFVPQKVERLLMFSTELTCFADLPTQIGAEEIVKEYKNPLADKWLEACKHSRDNGILTQEDRIEINFFVCNEGCLCGVSDEIFCELALDVWHITGNPLFFLNGYTNGCSGYLPTQKEWHKGGYEVLYSYFAYHLYNGRLMPYRPNTADRIVNTVVKNLIKIG